MALPPRVVKEDEEAIPYSRYFLIRKSKGRKRDRIRLCSYDWNESKLSFERMIAGSGIASGIRL